MPILLFDSMKVSVQPLIQFLKNINPSVPNAFFNKKKIDCKKMFKICKDHGPHLNIPCKSASAWIILGEKYEPKQ